jgi:hypothetical protein
VIPKDHDRSSIDIWFQDEARFGQQNTTTRLWAEKGSSPRAVRQQQCQYAYLFGSICPATGATEAIVTPYVNKEAIWDNTYSKYHRSHQQGDMLS